MKHPEESGKYDAQRSIFDELQGDSSGDETLCRMLDITSQTKWFLEGEIKDAKMTSFYLISKHSLNINSFCVFFMKYYKFEKNISRLPCFKQFHHLANDLRIAWNAQWVSQRFEEFMTITENPLKRNSDGQYSRK